MLAQDVSRRPGSGSEVIQRLKSVPEARGAMIPQAAASASSEALNVKSIPRAEGSSSGGSGTVMVARSVLPGMPGIPGLGKLPPALRRPVMLICGGLGVASLVAGAFWMLASRRADPLWRGCNVTMPHKQAVMPYPSTGINSIKQQQVIMESVLIKPTIS